MNASTLQVVTIGLLVCLVVSIFGIIYLIASGNVVPDILELLATGIVTGLLGLLAPSREATKQV